VASEETIALLKGFAACRALTPEQLAEFVYHVQVNRDFMSLFVSSAGTFISLAIGAIGLSVAFREKVLGQTGPLELKPLLVSAWVFLFLTVATGAFYLYAAPKHVQLRLECSKFAPLGIWPGHVYGACVAFFIMGSLLLFIAILRQSRVSPNPSIERTA
jgi:uncharacterized membrane protein